MITYIIRRVLYSIPVLLFSTFLSFLFVSYAGNPLANLLQNPRITKHALQHAIVQNHLDQPVPLRYFEWVWGLLLHGFGRSLLTGTLIWPQITRTIGHTAQLVVVAEVIAIAIGLAVGMYSAIRQYSPFDYAFTTLSFIGFAMPTFWLALLLQQLFVQQYNGTFGILKHRTILYTFGINTIGNNNAWSFDRLQHLALPAITLATINFAVYSRFMRASMLDVINSDYVRTARAKGVPERKVILKHVVPNALIPVVTVMALNVGGLLGGAIVTETIFALDGFGSNFLTWLGNGDMYMIMAYLVVTAVIIIVFNLVADILYGLLDPRIRYE